MRSYSSRFAVASLWRSAPIALTVILMLGAPGDASAKSGKSRGTDNHEHHSNRRGNSSINDRLDRLDAGLDILFRERAHIRVIPNGVTADTAPRPASAPGSFAGLAVCPDWAMPGGPEYTFRPDEWGTADDVHGGDPDRTGLAGMGDGDAPQSAACAWVAACNGELDCYARCPVAMAIGHGESGWYPNAYAWDGNGRGLWQINYQNTAPEWPMCDHNYNTSGRGPANPPTPKDPVDCPSLNPIENARKTIEFTNGGESFSPLGHCWSTCDADCFIPYSPGYRCSGSPNGELPPHAHDGPAEAQNAMGACDNAIRAITGSSFGGSYDAPERCALPSRVSMLCDNMPLYKCDPDIEDPDDRDWQCGSAGFPAVCVPTPEARESCDD